MGKSVGGVGGPQVEGGDGHGDEVGHGEVLEALEWSHGHVGGDGRPQGEGGMDFTKWLCHPTSKEVTEGIHPFCLMLVRVDILLKVLVDVAVFR